MNTQGAAAYIDSGSIMSMLCAYRPPAQRRTAQRSASSSVRTPLAASNDTARRTLYVTPLLLRTAHLTCTQCGSSESPQSSYSTARPTMRSTLASICAALRASAFTRDECFVLGIEATAC
jgi:hypothetical protein